MRCLSTVLTVSLLACLLAARHGRGETESASTPAWSPPAADSILKTLRPGHPRVLLTPEKIEQLKQLTREDPLAVKMLATVRADAVKVLDEPPSKYEIPDGRRLLSVSRKVLDRIRLLGFMWTMTGDARYADRAWVELSAAAKFKDWNPSHFLDTAEMTHAFALGYDWLYSYWNDDQRQTLREAIVRLGLEPVMKFYEPKPRSWARGTNNWNQVCNGGIGAGALAIADVEPELTATVLHHAIGLLPNAMRVYAPDGAGTEGTMYWRYGTSYNVVFLDALGTALGTDFGLAEIDGFGQSGDFQVFFSGAERMSFNFGDCSMRHLGTPQHFWLGTRFDIPRFHWFRRCELKRSPESADVLDLLWYDPAAREFDPITLPLDKYFRRAEVASMRSAWNDPDALVVGIEGSPTAHYSHRHLDSGTFIVEALGVRWLTDCGSERQTYLSHQHDHSRWDFYRIRAEGHNTLALQPGKGPDQVSNCPAPITRFESTPDDCVAELDLSRPYTKHAQRVTRTIAMVDRRYVTVEDRIEGADGVEAWWFAHTEAQVKLGDDGKTAVLEQDGKQLDVEIIEPADARLAVMDAVPLSTSPNPAIQADNTGYRKLVIHLKDIDSAVLAIKLAPRW